MTESLTQQYLEANGALEHWSAVLDADPEDPQAARLATEAYEKAQRIYTALIEEAQSQEAPPAGFVEAGAPSFGMSAVPPPPPANTTDSVSSWDQSHGPAGWGTDAPPAVPPPPAADFDERENFSNVSSALPAVPPPPGASMGHGPDTGEAPEAFPPPPPDSAESFDWSSQQSVPTPAPVPAPDYFESVNTGDGVTVAGMTIPELGAPSTLPIPPLGATEREPQPGTFIVKRKPAATRFVPPAERTEDMVAIDRSLAIGSMAKEKPAIGRERNIAGSLPDWSPLPPGEVIAPRRRRSM